MNTQIPKVTKGHFYVYFNLNLRCYGQLFVLVLYQALDVRSILVLCNLYFFVTNKKARIIE